MSDHLAAMFDLIVRRPFRRSAIDAAAGSDIRAKVAEFGVKFSVPFGGYKGRCLPWSPHLNWAEVFWFEYLRDYAQPMVHLAGKEVEFVLTYLSGVLEFVNGTLP